MSGRCILLNLVMAVSAGIACSWVRPAESQQPNVQNEAVQQISKQRGRYRMTGVVVFVDYGAGRVIVDADPMESLHLPALAMSVVVRDGKMLERMHKGQVVDVDLVREGNNFIVTKLR